MTPVAAKKTSLPGHQPVDVEHLVEVVAGVDRAPALVVVARPQPAEQLAAHAT